MDRALRDAGLARQAAVEGRVHLVREIVAGATPQPAPRIEGIRLPRDIARVRSAQRALAQPFAHEGCPAFRRMNAIAGRFERRTHRGVGVPRKAGAIAVAGDRGVELRLQGWRDLPVALTARRRGERCERRPRVSGGNLARVHLIVRIERPLDPTDLLVEHWAQDLGVVRAAKPLAVLTPKDAAVRLHEREYLVRDLAQQPHVGGLAHVERRAHVQTADIHMSVHAVRQVAPVEQRAEFGDERGEPVRRHGAILDEGHRPTQTGHVAEQTYTAIAQRPERLDFARIVDAMRRHCSAGNGTGEQSAGSFVDGRRRIIDQLDEIQSIHRRASRLETGCDARPGVVAPRQREHRLVHRLDRGRIAAQHLLRRRQSIIERGIRNGD